MQRVALITGRGNVIGIGNSTAPTLAMTGTAVVMSEVSPVGLANEPNLQGGMDPGWHGVESLVDAFRASGGTASAVPGDVGREADASQHGRSGFASAWPDRRAGEQR